MVQPDTEPQGLPTVVARGPARAVFLDRDGVLVREIVRDGQAYAPTLLADFQLAEGASEQVDRLRAAGLLCVVFTNQPEVARGTLPTATLDAMHRALRAAVRIDAIYVCPHDDVDDCACRKPRPGMLVAAAASWGVRLDEAFVIGDRWRDIDAGRAVGAFSILLDRPYSNCLTADARMPTLGGAVDLVLARLRSAEQRRSALPGMT